jgi:hypothetical protein
MVPVAYNEDLAARVRDKLNGVKGVSEQEMFGGLALMVAGNMCCGVLGDDLMVRVGPDLHHDALTRPHVRETGVSGRAVRGLVYVGRDGVADDAEFALWVDLGLAYARSLPAKAKPKPKAKARRRTAGH